MLFLTVLFSNILFPLYGKTMLIFVYWFGIQGLYWNHVFTVDFYNLIVDYFDSMVTVFENNDTSM